MEGIKSIDGCRAMELFKSKTHLTKKGLEEIRSIQNKMKAKRKRFR